MKTPRSSTPPVITEENTLPTVEKAKHLMDQVRSIKNVSAKDVKQLTKSLKTIKDDKDVKISYDDVIKLNQLSKAAEKYKNEDFKSVLEQSPIGKLLKEFSDQNQKETKISKHNTPRALKHRQQQLFYSFVNSIKNSSGEEHLDMSLKEYYLDLFLNDPDIDKTFHKNMKLFTKEDRNKLNELCTALDGNKKEFKTDTPVNSKALEVLKSSITSLEKLIKNIDDIEGNIPLKAIDFMVKISSMKSLTDDYIQPSEIVEKSSKYKNELGKEFKKDLQFIKEEYGKLKILKVDLDKANKLLQNVETNSAHKNKEIKNQRKNNIKKQIEKINNDIYNKAKKIAETAYKSKIAGENGKETHKEKLQELSELYSDIKSDAMYIAKNKKVEMAGTASTYASFQHIKFELEDIKLLNKLCGIIKIYGTDSDSVEGKGLLKKNDFEALRNVAIASLAGRKFPGDGSENDKNYKSRMAYATELEIKYSS